MRKKLFLKNCNSYIKSDKYSWDNILRANLCPKEIFRLWQFFVRIWPFYALYFLERCRRRQIQKEGIYRKTPLYVVTDLPYTTKSSIGEKSFIVVFALNHLKEHHMFQCIVMFYQLFVNVNVIVCSSSLASYQP